MTRALRFILPVLMAGCGYYLGIPGKQAASVKRVDEPAPIGSATSPAMSGESSSVMAALGALTQETGFTQKAELGRLLGSMNSSELRQLADHADRLPPGLRFPALRALIPAWSQQDPAAAAAWMIRWLDAAPKEARMDVVADDSGTIIEAWAKTAPHEAAKYAAPLGDTTFGAYILRMAIGADYLRGPGKNPGEMEPSEAVAWLLRMPAGNSQNTLVEHWFAASGAELSEDLELAMRFPSGPTRDAALTSILSRCGEDHPTRVLDLMNAHQLPPAAVAKIVKEAAKGNATEVAKWLRLHGKASDPSIALPFVAVWIENDFNASFTWALQQGIPIDEPWDNPRMSGPQETLWNLAARYQPDAALRWASQLPTGPERDRYLELLAPCLQFAEIKQVIAELPAESATEIVSNAVLTLEADASIEWAKTLEGELRREAWETIGYRFANRPADAPPLPPLPPGPDRDAMLVGMTLANGDSAFEHAQAITDPALRQQTLDDLAWEKEKFPGRWLPRKRPLFH